MPGPVTSLLYVSNSLLERSAEESAIDDIVATALSRNAALSVTGALLFTRKHFAQVLEGPEGAIEELMASIRKDKRHHEIDVIEVVEIEKRRFSNWSMAYSGRSSYIDRFIQALDIPNGGGDRSALAVALLRLMQEFTREN